jgi:SAM-dependent methyltransferase
MTEPAGKRVLLRPTACAICETFGNSDEVYPPTFDDASFNDRVFSARRLPDRVHYRMVRCRKCGLVRSDPAADQSALADLYGRSTFDYAAEVPNLRRTYGRYLARARRYCTGKSLLEIGCGNGFMLEEGLAQGYQQVRGVEPSGDAIASASPSVRDRIVRDIMRPGLFEDGEFDTACMFQVFDHLPQPGALLDQIGSVLGPGGVLLCFNHNVESVSARILGERSPIVDIEHCYLYSPATMSALMKQRGFDVLESGAATNTLSLRHFLHLTPAPAALKRGVMGVADGTRIGRAPLRLRLGNLYAIGRKQ